MDALRPARSAGGRRSRTGSSAGPTTWRGATSRSRSPIPICLIANALGSPPTGRHRPGARARGEGGGAGRPGAACPTARQQRSRRGRSPRATRRAATPARSRPWCSCPRWWKRCHPTPVLAAGGIGTGRQIAAALSLGAQGVWLGSLWLTTAESNAAPAVLQAYLEASSADTVRSRCYTGKPARHAAQRLDGGLGGPRGCGPPGHAPAEHPDLGGQRPDRPVRAQGPRRSRRWVRSSDA